MSDEARLIKTLTERYEKIGKVARPVVNSSKPIRVSLSLMLYQLINVDESEQFITLKFWVHTVCYRLRSFSFISFFWFGGTLFKNAQGPRLRHFISNRD